ncbi:MAG: VanW family protein [Fibrella sp.]|nr:VanW family protein [Armatimonadota bacterium]
MITLAKASFAGIVGVASLGAVGASVSYLNTLPPPETRMSAFATRLEGRSRAQRHNAELAANSLDGRVIAPGGTFSFNNVVRGWSVDRGYVRAPVSFDGELVPAFGGGVCQASTTLYNAALLSGLTIAERHHHVFAPHYIAPGRDAAVAYPSLDLRLTNPYPFPIRLRSSTNGNQLRVEVWGKKLPAERYSLVSRVLSTNSPEVVSRHIPLRPGLPAVSRRSGATGFRIVTYRVIRDPEKQDVRRERLSDDSYPAMPGVIRYGMANGGGTRKNP